MPLAGFVDIDGIKGSVVDLQKAFDKTPEVLHAFEAKANPLVPVLNLVRACGLGCGVASPGELALLCRWFCPGSHRARLTGEDPQRASSRS